MGETELVYLVCRICLVYFVQRIKELRRTGLQLSI